MNLRLMWTDPLSIQRLQKPSENIRVEVEVSKYFNKDDNRCAALTAAKGGQTKSQSQEWIKLSFLNNNNEIEYTCVFLGGLLFCQPTIIFHSLLIMRSAHLHTL